MIKTYEKYKESGEEWVGEIPESWSIARLKFISSITKGKKPKNDFIEFYEGLVPYLSMEFLRGKTKEPLYANKDEKGLLYVSKGDILILWDGSKAGEIVEAKDGILSSTMALIKIESKLFNDFYLNYLLQLGQSHIQKNTIGMGIPHVDGNILKDLLILTPSLPEQKQIAKYLDHQTGIVDALIAKKELLIEKLKEQRQAIINESVTKGLNPNALLKDSGIAWLGKIPKHWEVCKIKHLTDLKSGDFISALNIEPFGEYPVLGGNGLRGFTKNYNLNGDYILIGRQGALCGNINYAHNKTWATEHAIIAYPILEFDTYYFGELLRAMDLNQYSESAAQPGIAVGKISNLSIPKISLAEQKEISIHIKIKSSLIHNLIESIQTQIEKLKSYRQSIISEAVTGKIDVRGWVAGK